MQLSPPNLRFLRLQDQVFTENDNYMLLQEFQRVLSCLIDDRAGHDQGRFPSLVLLVVHGGTIPDNLPSLPELVHLDLQQVTLPAQLLYRVLQGSPKLEHLSLMPNMRGPRPTTDVAYLRSPATRRLVFPHLRMLKISAPANYADALLKVLPDPGSQLEITLVTAGTDPRTDTNKRLADIDPILARVHQYWITASGELCLPDGRLNIYWAVGRRTGVLTFGHAHETISSSSQQRLSKSLNHISHIGDCNKPSMYFSTEYDLWEQHTLLHEVQTVQILMPSRHTGEPETGKQRLRLQESLKMYCVIDLPRLNTLTIRNAILSDDSEYRQVTQFLFDRQASRFQAIALQLQRCDRSWQQVVSQLEASGLVSSATCI
jgi:hypothetical protein